MSNEVILLRAYAPSKNPEVVCRPVQDETGNTYTGQGETGHYESLSEEEKRKMGYVVTPSTSLKITNGHVLHLNRERDKINWKWLQKHPYITMKEEANRPNDAAFFVFKKEEAAKANVSRAKERTQIMAQIFEMTEEDQRRLASAIGLGENSGFSIDEVLDYLTLRVDENPKVVKPLIGDHTTVGAQSLLQEAINKGVVTRSRGWLKFEEVNLGNGEANAVEFLKDPQNEEVAVAIRLSIKEIE